MNIYYIIIIIYIFQLKKEKKRRKKTSLLLYIYSVNVVAATALPKLGEEGKEK